MKRHSDILFSILIVLSVLVLMPFVLRNDLFGAKEADSGDLPPIVQSDEAAGTEEAGSFPDESASLTESVPAGESSAANDSSETEGSLTEAEAETENTAEAPSLEEFFSDALFIGDSRTVGLMEYAGLDTADFFATSGMSTFQVLTEEVSVPNVGKMTLTTLFEQKSYGKIFLMLGINELGYNFSSVVSQYGKVVDFVRQMQPQATLYVCANLHLTSSRSDSDDIYNNENINRLNAEIAAMADNENIFYLDVNPLFDDENGALNAQYSADDTHPYGKYYAQWGQWIYDTCVQSKPAQ